MSDLRIDYGRAEADRRMRLLEMAGGDLDKAIKLECWVRCGVTDPNALARPLDPSPVSQSLNVAMLKNTDDLSIPPHLRRTA